MVLGEFLKIDIFHRNFFSFKHYRQAGAAPRFQDWGEQKNAEREAAIAAAAAATGNEGNIACLRQRCIFLFLFI